MSNPIVLTLTAHDAALREEINRELAPYAEIQQVTQMFGLNEIKLVIEIINGSAGIAASAAAVSYVSWLDHRVALLADPQRLLEEVVTE